MWHILDVVGTIAFVASGATVAVEERYDIFGIVLLGLITAFGGGVLRNVLLGIPVSELWGQRLLLISAFSVAAIYFVLPSLRKDWGWLTVFDAVGVAAFAVQAGVYARLSHHTAADIIIASTITGIGGGMIRDVLAHRHPVVLKRNEFYAIWAVLDGVAVAMGFGTTPWQASILVAATVGLRLASVYWSWKVPLSLSFRRSGLDMQTRE